VLEGDAQRAELLDGPRPERVLGPCVCVCFGWLVGAFNERKIDSFLYNKKSYLATKKNKRSSVRTKFADFLRQRSLAYFDLALSGEPFGFFLVIGGIYMPFVQKKYLIKTRKTSRKGSKKSN
jgi:hypothetical protein